MARCLNRGCNGTLEAQSATSTCPQCHNPSFVALIYAYGKDGIRNDRLAAYLNVAGWEIDNQWTDQYVSVQIKAFPEGEHRRLVHIAHLGYVERYNGGWGPASEPSSPKSDNGTSFAYGFDEFFNRE